MKSTYSVIVIAMLAGLAETALAACPSSLSADQMIDCIVKENAGYVYQMRGKSDTPSVVSTNDPSTAASNPEEAPVAVSSDKTQSK